MYKYIKNTKSIDIVETNEQAFRGGKLLKISNVII